MLIEIASVIRHWFKEGVLDDENSSYVLEHNDELKSDYFFRAIGISFNIL